MQHERRDLCTAGVAAGISAAFQSPIGGVLFALEDVATYWSVKVTWEAFICAAVALLAFRALSDEGDVFTTHLLTTAGADDWGNEDLIPFCVLGMCTGVVMSLFTNIAIFSLKTHKRHLTWLAEPAAKVGYAACVAFVLSSVMFVLPLLDDCRGLPTADDELHHHRRHLSSYSAGDYVSYGCSEGSYNPLASVYLPAQSGASEHVLKLLLDRGDGEEYASTWALAVFAGSYVLLTLFVIPLAVPYGLFVPHLLFGAAFGRVFGELLASYGGSGTGFARPGVYALMGAGAALGSFTRMTIAVTTIMMEITGDTKFLLPVMMVIVVAKFFADLLARPFVEEVIAMRDIPLIPEFPHHTLVSLEAKDVMNSAMHMLLSEGETIGHVACLLAGTKHNGFPVVTYDADDVEHDKPIFVSFIKRRKLFSLLRKKLQQLCPEMLAKEPGLVERLVVPLDVLDERIDISRHVEGTKTLFNQLGLIIEPELPFHRVYGMMSKNGLRHVLVVEREHGILLGIITRQDIIAADEESGSGGGEFGRFSYTGGLATNKRMFADLPTTDKARRNSLLLTTVTQRCVDDTRLPKSVSALSLQSLEGTSHGGTRVGSAIIGGESPASSNAARTSRADSASSAPPAGTRGSPSQTPAPETALAALRESGGRAASADARFAVSILDDVDELNSLAKKGEASEADVDKGESIE